MGCGGVTNMSGMFSLTDAFNGDLEVGCQQRNEYVWDVHWHDCLQWGYLEVGCQQRNEYEWDVHCTMPNGDISNWNVSNNE